MGKRNYLKANSTFFPDAINICPGSLSNELCKVLEFD